MPVVGERPGSQGAAVLHGRELAVAEYLRLEGRLDFHALGIGAVCTFDNSARGSIILVEIGHLQQEERKDE